MPGRLRWYIGAVGVAGLLALAILVPTIDLDRARDLAGAIALFAGFVIGGELVSIRLQRNNRVKDLAVTTTFAYGLVPLTGTAVAVLVFMFASIVADLGRGKPAYKTLFNAAQCVLALAAGGLIYHALGGG
jgi:zinc transporter ZupT